MLNYGYKTMNKSTPPNNVKRFSSITPLAFRIYSSTFALIISLIFNALASLSVFNGISTGEVSDLYPSLFTPSGSTFVIWAFIYTSLIYFSVNQLSTISTLEYATHRERFFKLHGWYFLISMLNAMWIVLWQFQIIVGSLIIIIAMLYALIQIVLLLRKQSFFTRLPFSLYAAWITVATIANLSIYLTSTDYVASVTIAWNQPGAVLQTVAILCIVTMVAALWIFRERDYVVGVVVAWSLYGIYLRHAIELDRAYISVLETALFLTIAIVVWTTFVWFYHRRFTLSFFRK